MEKLRDQLVECPDEQDAYYKVTVHRRKDGTCTATIPNLGRVQVAKEIFAWKIKGGVINAHTN
jgi:hypothetical protein